MWTNLRIEIKNICKAFDFTDSEFKSLGLNDWQEIEENIYRVFCKQTHYKYRPVWLWEYFKLDTFLVSTEQKPYLFLDRLIDNTDTVWFFVNETVNESHKFWFYQGQVKPIQKIIAESCYIDELYLVSKKYDWLLCINHHDILIATGQTMPEKLKDLATNPKYTKRL